MWKEFGYAFCLMVLSIPVWSQTPDSRLRRMHVLETHGRLEDFVRLRAMTLDQPILTGIPTKDAAKKLAFRQTRLDEFVQELAMRYTYDEVLLFRKKGIDLLGYATKIGGYTDTDHMYAQQDGILIGKIVRLESDSSPNDGHSTTAIVAVEEWLKGRERPDTIHVRIITGNKQGGTTTASIDFINFKGKELIYPKGRFLYFVSQERYPLFVATLFKKSPPPNSKFYLFMTPNVEIHGDSLVYAAPLFGTDKYPETLTELRRLGKRYK